ncbi:MAG: hypothetical protein JXA18_01400 [Chitinispirillaceae bacterium]|nr:hypothetical protein [Chitinispirillaceae bacterium]
MGRKLFLFLLSLCVVVNAQAADETETSAQGEEVMQESEVTAAAADDTKEKLAELDGKLAGMEESYLETKSTVGKLAKLKISGYVQAQFQVAETLGVQTSKAGSKFDTDNQSKFFVRRGRIKFNYNNGLSQYVLQFDASHGGFEIKDAYLSFTEPWLKYFTGTMGIFDRPFGYEISYSSSMRESPERSRIYQDLFPKEREVGARLAFAADRGPLRYINIKGGVFNGVTPLQLDNDTRKDVIGRVGFEIPLRDAGMGIDGGFSGYYGAVTNTDTASGGLAYEMDGKAFKELTGKKGAEFLREYMGLDLQYFLDIPLIGGLTLRGEYLWGVQPGTSSKTSFYQPSAGGAPNGAVYSRNFAGYYLYWVQCWGTRVQSVLKYDAYDPNIDVEGNDVGASGSRTSSADLTFTTFGVGLIYHWDDNLKFMAYYDMPRNEESSNLATTNPYKNFSRDLPDNVFTLRLQYKF